MLSGVCVDVKCGRVRYVTTSFIGNHCNVIADLALVRIAFEWIERIAHGHIRRPRHASIGTKGIKQLGICVVRSIASVIPNCIQASIWRYRKRSKPVPLIGINRIVIHLDGCAKGCSSICAAHKHHVRCGSPRRRHTGQHVNVVVSRSTRVINRQEQHSIQSCWIYSATRQFPAHIDLRNLIKDWRLIAKLRVARAHTIKRAESFTAYKEVAIGVHVQRSVCGLVRNNDWRLPGNPPSVDRWNCTPLPIQLMPSLD